MKHTHLLAAVLAVAVTGCFSDTGNHLENSTDSESDDSDGSESGQSSASGPDMGSGGETDSDGNDSGGGSGGSTGGETDSDSMGTDTAGETDTAGGTDTAGETDGDTDGGTGDTGMEPTVLDEGDLCHPLGANTLPCDPNLDLVCAYDGYDNGEAQYEWACKEYSGLPGEGQYGDECFDFNESTDCDTGFKCDDATLAGVGVCDNDEIFCCLAHCNPLLGGIDCPANTFCESIHPNENQYPDIIQNSQVTTIGLCRS